MVPYSWSLKVHIGQAPTDDKTILKNILQLQSDEVFRD
jgi:hypothetical protein